MALEGEQAIQLGRGEIGGLRPHRTGAGGIAARAAQIGISPQGTPEGGELAGGEGAGQCTDHPSHDVGASSRGADDVDQGRHPCGHERTIAGEPDTRASTGRREREPSVACRCARSLGWVGVARRAARSASRWERGCDARAAPPGSPVLHRRAMEGGGWPLPSEGLPRCETPCQREESPPPCDSLGAAPPAGFEPATHGLGNRCSIP
jgi:hypothetical protein